MPNNWKTYKLSDFLHIKNGKSKPKEIGNIPIYGGNGILGYSNKYNVDKNVLIIGRVGAYCGAVYYETKPVWISDNALYTFPKNNDNLKYVYYLLKHIDLNQFAGGSSQPLLTQDTLNRIEVNLPPLQEQQSIASILSAIDDKIENNLAINKTLEEMAMALYKHWFVDFGPFKDGEFVESELGLIPKGWEVKRLDELADILNSKRIPLSTNQRSKRKGVYPYYGASGIIDYIDDYIFDGEYILISEDGENLRSRSTPIAFSAFGKFWVNNHAHILKEKQIGYNYLIICHFSQLDMNPYLTGAVQPKLNKQNLLQIGIPLPKDSKLAKDVFDKFEHYSNQIISNTKENQTLTQLRDTLLPKLISGEVRLKEFRE